MGPSLSVQAQSSGKTRVCLHDYDYQKDISLRTFLATLSGDDIAVLEEILYNPLEFPVKKIKQNLSLTEDIIENSLQKLQETNLFVRISDQLSVCKELRKYFETQIAPFDPTFRCDMDYVQQILRKVPIEVLPKWYQISRTSHKIFDSVLDKFLLTPQLYNRYLKEHLCEDNLSSQLMETLLDTPNLRLPLNSIQKHFGLSYEELHAEVLRLEFNFLAYLGYEIENDCIVEYITPFVEWKDYTQYVQAHHPQTITDDINRLHEEEYVFVDGLARVLQIGKFTLRSIEPLIPSETALQTLHANFPTEPTDEYMQLLLKKSTELHLAEVCDNAFYPTEYAAEWASYPSEKRAHLTYRHQDTLPTDGLSTEHWPAERIMLEVERALKHIVDAGWIYLDDFVSGVPLALKEEDRIQLCRKRQSWWYHIPSHPPEDELYIKNLVTDYLFFTGMVRLGTCDDKLCFCLTNLGKTCFAEKIENTD